MSQLLHTGRVCGLGAARPPLRVEKMGRRQRELWPALPRQARPRAPGAMTPGTDSSQDQASLVLPSNESPYVCLSLMAPPEMRQFVLRPPSTEEDTEAEGLARAGLKTGLLPDLRASITPCGVALCMQQGGKSCLTRTAVV